MKTHRVKNFKPVNLKYTGRRKYLTYDVKKYINRWFCVYCENTNLHGFRYISMAGSTIFEAIFWLVICVSSIIFCFILMRRIWDNYSRHPIATAIDTSDPITDLLFPAVLICNNNKIYRSQAEVIAKLLHENGFTKKESELFFHSLPNLLVADKVSLDNATALRILDTLNTSVEALMEKLMQPCSALLVRCGWVGRAYDCNQMFKTVKSKEGFCCAFNFHYNATLHFEDNMHGIDFDDLNDSDNIRLQNLPGVATILNVPGTGRDAALTVAINVERDMYMAVTRPFAGATLMVHDPIDYPAVGTHVALPDHLLLISVSCTAIHGTGSLQSLPVNKRMCYLEEEMQAKASSEIRYNYESCLTTCVGRYIIEKCGCLPIFYPKIVLEDLFRHFFNATYVNILNILVEGARTCYLPDIECMLEIKNTYSINSINHVSRMAHDRLLKFSGPPPSNEIFDTKEKCGECLPECTDVLYRTTAESIEFDETIGYKYSLLHDLDVPNVSVIQVFFDEMFYVHYHRESTMSWDALLASFGGVFGLCLGGSVISVIEVIYLLVRKFFRRESCKRQETFYNGLPPASKVFLSIPVKKVWMQSQKFNDEHDSVTWYPLSSHKHKF